MNGIPAKNDYLSAVCHKDSCRTFQFRKQKKTIYGFIVNAIEIDKIW